MVERLSMTSLAGNNVIYLPSTVPKIGRRINYDLLRNILCQQEGIWLKFCFLSDNMFVKFIIRIMVVVSSFPFWSAL